jgi:hypothetical protein
MFQADSTSDLQHNEHARGARLVKDLCVAFMLQVKRVCSSAPALAIVEARMVHAAAHINGPAMLQRQRRCLKHPHEPEQDVNSGMLLLMNTIGVQQAGDVALSA